MLEKTVSFPNNMDIIEGDTLSCCELDDNVAKLVVYIDSTECSLCHINAVNDIRSIILQNGKQDDIMLVVIVEPNSNNTLILREQLESKSFAFDIYIDRYHQFCRENNFISRTDSRLHTFLIDRTNKIVSVGNPAHGESLLKLFLDSARNI